jgi:hypothetical protein
MNFTKITRQYFPAGGSVFPLFFSPPESGEKKI